MMKAGGRERGEWPWGGYTFVDLGLAFAHCGDLCKVRSCCT